MKEITNNKVVMLLSCVFMFLLTIFYFYKSLQDFVLIIKHEQIEVTITDATYHNGYKHSYYTYRFEYLIDNQVYESAIDVSWSLFSNLIHDKYHIGDIETVYYNNTSKEFKDFVFSDLRFDIFISVLLLALLIFIFSGIELIPSNGKYFYIQLNNYKIKKYPLLKMGFIEDHISQLEHNKIICCGFNNAKRFTEFSYENGSFFVRTSENEEIKEINREEVIEQSNILRRKLVSNS